MQKNGIIKTEVIILFTMEHIKYIVEQIVIPFVVAVISSLVVEVLVNVMQKNIICLTPASRILQQINERHAVL